MTDTDDEEIDDEQVEDYCTMLDKLGRHPDKVAIVSLSRISARRGARLLISTLSPPPCSSRIHSQWQPRTSPSRQDQVGVPTETSFQNVQQSLTLPV